MNKYKIIVLIIIVLLITYVTVLAYLFKQDGCFVDCDYIDTLIIANTVIYECTNNEILVADYGKNEYLDIKIYTENNTEVLPRLIKSGSKYSILKDNEFVEFSCLSNTEVETCTLKVDGEMEHTCSFQASGE